MRISKTDDEKIEFLSLSLRDVIGRIYGLQKDLKCRRNKYNAEKKTKLADELTPKIDLLEKKMEDIRFWLK